MTVCPLAVNSLRQSSLPLSTSNASTNNCRSGSPAEQVTITRPPTTMGLDTPRPGSSAFQAIFRSGRIDQSSGSFASVRFVPPPRKEGQSASVNSASARPAHSSAVASARPPRRQMIPNRWPATLSKNDAPQLGPSLSPTGHSAYADGRDSRQKSRWPPNDRPRERDKRYSLSAPRSSDQRPAPLLLLKNQR
jgi:hypothetical protein